MRITKTTVIAAVAAGLLGVGIGAAGQSDASPTVLPGVTETVTAPPVTKTIEARAPIKTVEVTKTNPACLDALEKADEAMTLDARGLQLAGEGFGMIADGDLAGLQANTAKIRALTPRIRSAMDAYASAKAECRNGGTA